MSKVHINWDKEKIDFIVQKYTSKEMNTVQLAKYFGCSNDTISRRLKEQGITPHKFYEDLTGQKFGRLTVLGKSEKSGRRLYWDCLCDCGKRIVVKGDHLRQRNQLSCGCLTSIGEKEIASLLEQNDIQYISQYKFNDFTSEINNIPYRFDFAIIENNKLKYLIEYDGEQHYTFSKTTQGWNNQENFEKTILRDQKKNSYCFEHNIPLIRIPYWIKDKLTIEDLSVETSKYIVKKE